MAAGRQSAQWDHTCSVMATIINVNRGKNKPLIRPNQLHPMMAKRSGGGLPFDPETVRAISAALKAREV